MNGGLWATRQDNCRGRGRLHAFTPSLHESFGTQVSPLLQHLQSQPHFTTLTTSCCIALSPLCGWTWSHQVSSVSRPQRFQLLWLNARCQYGEGFLAWLSFVPVTLPLSWRQVLFTNFSHLWDTCWDSDSQPDCGVLGKNGLMSFSRERLLSVRLLGASEPRCLIHEQFFNFVGKLIAPLPVTVSIPSKGTEIS